MTLSLVMSTMESSSQHNFGIASPLDMAVGSYQLMVKGFSWCVSLWDQIAITQTRFTTLPPIFLRHRVHGDAPNPRRSRTGASDRETRWRRRPGVARRCRGSVDPVGCCPPGLWVWPRDHVESHRTSILKTIIGSGPCYAGCACSAKPTSVVSPTLPVNPQ